MIALVDVADFPPHSALPAYVSILCSLHLHSFVFIVRTVRTIDKTSERRTDDDVVSEVGEEGAATWSSYERKKRY